MKPNDYETKLTLSGQPRSNPREFEKSRHEETPQKKIGTTGYSRRLDKFLMTAHGKVNLRAEMTQ